jgi:phosphotriesterase-related protein
MRTVHTVTGPVTAADLGKTLVHEHLLIGYPGWFMDALAPRFVRAEALARGVDTLQALRDLGVATLVDPCPMDLGRDVEFMAEVSQRSGVRIVCATGAYKEDEGLTYTFRALPLEEIAAIYVRELTEGIGGTGIRAGLVKVATSAPVPTAYEQKLLEAGGIAAAEVGCPVLTHTDDARGGLEQIAVLTGKGVPAHRILVGHSDGRADHAYHASLADAHAYVGFDRFGLETLLPDALRIDSVCRMIDAGYVESVCLSHDAICAAWLGRPVFGGRFVTTPEKLARRLPHWEPTHLFRRILPALRARGVGEDVIETLLVDNPLRYFEGRTAPRRRTASAS